VKPLVGVWSDVEAATIVEVVEVLVVVVVLVVGDADAAEVDATEGNVSASTTRNISA
jgi:hypothetical protein